MATRHLSQIITGIASLSSEKESENFLMMTSISLLIFLRLFLPKHQAHWHSLDSKWLLGPDFLAPVRAPPFTNLPIEYYCRLLQDVRYYTCFHILYFFSDFILYSITRNNITTHLITISVIFRFSTISQFISNHYHFYRSHNNLCNVTVRCYSDTDHIFPVSVFLLEFTSCPVLEGL